MTLDFSSIKRFKSQEKSGNSPPSDINIQALSDKNRANLEQAARICAEHQKNTLLTDSLQCKINKGLKSGESIYTLFLKAVQAISLMTGNTVFYDVAKKDLLAVYGVGLEEPQALELELNEIQKRLDKLKQSEQTALDLSDKQRIKWAIEEHKKAKEFIEKKLERTDNFLND